MTTIGNASGAAFEQYTGEVYGWAYRLLGRHHDALDVVQDVFLRWHAQCRHEVPKRARGWLRRVTLNRAVDLCRRRRTDRDASDAMVRSVDRQDPSIERLDQDVLRSDIAAAFDRLSDAQRAVLVAKVYDGMTFAEIAAELDVAVSTAKTHYLRAVQAVRDQLRPRWAEEA
ncbi:MAG: sigma-70 family RNA polymerase sigma factor [Phycisphaerae bacterium]|jgi:RNA polymerase sigma-70 factor (ECF subfamily)